LICVSETILESEPEPKPVQSENPGRAQIVDSSTDALTIEADMEQPAILLITDVYTPSWRAVAFPGSVQSNYHLQPANYILRAGTRFRPVTIDCASNIFRARFEIGKWISIVSMFLFGSAIYRFRQVKL